MLFNSYPFIFAFLPITFIVFFSLARRSHALAAGWLTAASLFFYAWWHPSDLGLLLASIAFNYMLGRGIARAAADGRRRRAQWILAIAVAVDLLVLGYFKYANFFLGSILILGEPSDYWLPQRYFLDTVYHLNADGRAIRTARLLAQLRGRL